MKTEAGKQRIVPIHSKIKDLVKRNMDFAESIGSEYLFNDKGQPHAGSWKMTYDKYANRYKKGYQTVGIKSGSPATRSSKDIHHHGEKSRDR